jgi:ribosomal protein RSM22 (predicted rRNA methylase)
MQLPEDLGAAIETALRGVPAREVTSAVRTLSQRYRDQYGNATSTLLRSDAEVTAYAAYRLPATYAAIAAVLREARERQPALDPRTLLDVGGGPGTAAWAAAQIWPHLQRVTVLERDGGMVRLGRQLAWGANAPVLRGAGWEQVDVTGPWDVPPADLAIAAYMLGEISAGAREALVQTLWDHALATCVIVEPGTPRGFEALREATQGLAALGAHITAPFPAEWNCLEGPGDWCHFSQRVPRTRLHRAVKEGTLSHEDEKYSYVVASRLPGTPIAGRVIRHPQVRSGHIRLTLCTADGVKHLVVTRSSKEAFRRARDLTWGSAVTAEDAGLYGLG